jgi:transcriptional regulator with PAS, ATPase and Fis domain
MLDGVSTVFQSLGRTLICLDAEFRVIHASGALEGLLGSGAVDAVLGRSAEELFGQGLFGDSGTLQRALQAGERREGWGATIQTPTTTPRLVSLTVAPIQPDAGSGCDPRVSYVLVLRGSGEHDEADPADTMMFSGLVARSNSMKAIFRLVEQLEESDAAVLILGESGTGKELIARAVHERSTRRKGAFVAVNCGALPSELLESELFGHVEGAFTGAIRDRVGRFELAQGGTIFLDEVAEIPQHLQVKLLRVLQERTFERVGESTSRTTNARVIAATNRDIKRAVLDGDFRDDLYYRLRVVPIAVPPLRERREDIEPITRYLLNRVNERHGRSVRLAPDAVQALLTHSWPGNVRELENALEYALAVCQGQTVHAEDLPRELLDSGVTRDRDAGLPASDPPAPPILQSQGGTSERQAIEAALRRARWNRTRAAQALGVSRSTLWRKMRELGL